ncbi:MAG: site-specific DNA-methyltransferase, partial [Propionibacteriales bacterium]|nr:site-specific DNA-methyltransferase [Propionibacteriales bacterium]
MVTHNQLVQPFVVQTLAELAAQRPLNGQELVHFTESLATKVIEEYSSVGDVVLDPFAGFGTTLVVAERLGRRAIGVELMDERAEQIRSRVTDAVSVVRGDARSLA